MEGLGDRRDLVINVDHLTKRYGARVVVRDLNLQMRAGDVVALLGPNGAGKTTSLGMLEGFIVPTAGHIRILGYEPARRVPQFFDRVGFVFQETALDPLLTVRETLALFRAAYSAPLRIEEVADWTGLTDHQQRRVGQLSGGQRRRVDLAVALIGNPDVLFLDEMTTGFDPHARREAWTMLAALIEQAQKTVILTTHYLDEAEHLAQRVVILDDGVVIADGSVADLAVRYGWRDKISFRVPPQAKPPLGVAEAGHAGYYQCLTADVTRDVHRLTAWALANNISLADFVVGPPTLEEIYLAITHDRGATHAHT